MTEQEPTGGYPGAELAQLLATWLPHQRWYPAGPQARLTAGTWREIGASPRVAIHIVHLCAPGTDVALHIPLVLLPGVSPALGGPHQGAPLDPSAVIGALTIHGREWTVIDGAAHPAGWAALLRLTTWYAGATPAPDLAGARPLGVEQSNSSVLLPHVAGGALLKILRTIAPGPHPDIEVPRALAGQGWAGVPRPLGEITVPWEDGDPPGRTAPIAILSAFVSGADDGFDVAKEYAGRGESFAESARDLGRTVARMHAALRRSFGATEPPERKWWLADLRRRASDTIIATPALAGRAEAITAFLDRIDATIGPELPARQRIHGDLHLGQTLRTPRDWLILDFEGEPLRPVAERTRPDLALRDVAGMLRSLDYAAALGSALRSGSSTSRQSDTPPVHTAQLPTAADWAAQAGAGFLAGYREGASADPVGSASTGAVLAALVFDKVVYEVAYEAHHRPDWIHIPLGALDQLTG